MCVKNSPRAGGLFKYISKQVKQFLNVDLSSMGGVSRDPDRFLQIQLDAWTKFWAPGSADVEEAEHRNIHTLLVGLRGHAIRAQVDPPITPVL